MSSYKSDFLRVLQERGFIHQMSNEEGLDEAAAERMLTAYIGFDCTAKSLHIGNLLGIMMLYWFQQTGHRPIVLMGNGTTRIGDPSGKDEARQLRSEEEINENMLSIRTVFEKFLTFGDEGNQAIMEYNDSWLSKLNYINFLRDFGRHFSVNRMLTFDSVKLRLDREQPLSFIEFNYMIFQAYDYLELNKKYDCELQMGGSDQWGNIINGVDLTRRSSGKEVFALTCPLLTTSSGAKMGKTAQGAVWLNSDMYSPWEYWQYWRNTEDDDVVRFLKLYTTLPLDEIERLSKLEGAKINDVKKILATEATAMIHGREAALLAQKTAEDIFEKGKMSADLPTFEINITDLENGYGILKAFVDAGLVTSNSDARRQIKGGALKLNDIQLKDEAYILTTNDLSEDAVIKLSMGKKRHVLLKPV